MYSLLAMLMMVMATFSFVSCSEDEYEAYTLDGAWEGDMGVYYNGYRSVRSIIHFDLDPNLYASGTGYQVDYFNYSTWYDKYGHDYIASIIDWEVRNRVIHIYYRKDRIHATIRDYNLNNGYFEGYIDYDDGTSSYFHLMKTYDRGWDYYYYSKPAISDFGTRATVTDGLKPEKPVRSAKPSVIIED